MLAAAGCTDDLDIPSLESSEYLTFYADMQQTGIKGETRGSVGRVAFTEKEWSLTPDETEQGESTRATLTKTLSGKARIYAYNYDTGETNPHSETNIVIKGADYTFVENMLTSATPQKWSGIEKKELDVYSYTPVLDTDIFDISRGEPTIEYTVNSVVSEQVDLILADVAVKDVEAHNRKPLNLNYKHALTAVRFRSGFTNTIKVKSIAIEGVYDKGTYALWDKSGHGNWKRLDPDNPSKGRYEISFDPAGKDVNAGEDIVTGEDTFILMPQTLPAGAKVILTLSDKTLEIPLQHFVWESGVMVTYTIYETKAPSYIYFDLAAGNVVITGKSYVGYRYAADGTDTKVEVKGTLQSNEEYYVYQSTSTNRANIWTADETGKLLTFTRPVYNDVVVTSSGKSWKEYITNNTSVEDVIANWKTASATAGMNPADYYIDVSGTIGECKITLDNVYSIYEQFHGHNQSRTFAGIGYKPTGSNNKLSLDLLGDNRLGAIHYDNRSNSGNKLILKGNGSLTVADPQGNNSNWWNSVIGNNDSNNECYGIQIDGGVIFAGSTDKEDCTAIGGGGNGTGEVTINGGVVTAVASTTGTAIGGGIGHNSPGGLGLVTITGGTVYAYNFKQREKNIPVAAIGGAGSMTNYAHDGTTINITGGTIYAESYHGPAIGGGGSYKKRGGDATIAITGGDITAITKNKLSCAIGGGSSNTEGSSSSGLDGGKATITISGNPVIRTGSIGGGITGATGSKIGTANITIKENPTIQGQFLLAAGAATPPTFTMSGGTINGKLSEGNFTRKREDGGAVYMEDGTFTFSGGVIENCKATRGGAVYLAGGEFKMSGGIIRDCESTSHGGAIFMNKSSVHLTGGEISNNLAFGGNGGGVYIIGNDFHMEGNTSIKGNSAINKGNNGGYGGGVYVFSDDKDVTVNLHSGSIVENTSEQKGGGVCVVINQDHKAIVTVGEQNGGNVNPEISRNHTLLQGAGLHVQGTQANITIESGKIKGNKVGAYVTNNDVSNEGGLVYLNGGDVTHNVITFHANYAGANPATTSQYVVTATRSQLVPPTLRRQGYEFAGWSTKKDGSGELYHSNDVVNIDSDLNLYAKWIAK